jgi:hypothetical protein
MIKLLWFNNWRKLWSTFRYKNLQVQHT